MTWSYAGGIFTFYDQYGDVSTAPLRIEGTKMVSEEGTAGVEGYTKYTFSKTPVTIPGMPGSISPYTGSASTLTGTWNLTMQEACTEYNDGTSSWWNYYIGAGMFAYTINADNTYSASMGGQPVESGTWSFSQSTGEITITPSSGESAIGVPGKMTVVAGATPSKMSMAYFTESTEEGDAGFIRMTLEK
jgi:hypothetical protein